MSDTVTVKVNGQEVEVPAGTNMIEAARKLGIDIPHYCYHPHLTIAGNCRMCLVDVEAGGRGPDISCNMGARDGLAIRTDTEQVEQMRKSVMEFLLVNHPLDCPICDQAGECRLQDYYMDYGKYESRLTDAKVNKRKRQDIGEHIVLDAERCVQCSRCVRFGDEITETGELRLFSRTNHTEIGIFPGDELRHHYQGCLADICPVGALTSKDFRFQKRVWYMRETPSVCNSCATGCNIQVCHEQGEVFRYLPRRNDQVNDSWMCDFGRMTYSDISSMKRLIRVEHKGDKTDLNKAAELLKSALDAARDAAGEASIGFVLSGQETNEATWAFCKMAREVAPDAKLFVCDGNDPGAFDYSDELLVSQDKNANLYGARVIGQHFDAEIGRDALAKWVGELKLMVVLGGDVLGRLGKDDFDTLVYLGTYRSPTSEAAEYIFPTAAHVEQDGTFTNKDGRVQRLRRALPSEGDSLPAYRLIHELSAVLGKPTETQLASVTFKKLAAGVGPFSGMSYQSIGDQGQVLGSADEPAPPPAPESAESQPSA